MPNSYRDLKVWQKAFELSITVYRLTASFPRDELFGLTSQLRRAAVSTVSNIAEGYGRNTRGDYKQFLGIARGSAFEVQTQLAIARELRFGDSTLTEAAVGIAEEVSKMLYALIAKL